MWAAIALVERFVGSFEENGLKLAGTVVPIAYTVWSLGLVATGVVLLT